MTWTALVKVAPILTHERQNSPGWTRPDRWLWRSNALRILPSLATPKLCVDHDEEQVIGYVEDILRLEDVDGPWFMGRCVVTNPPGWLKRGTPASLSSKILARSTFSEDIICDGFVHEISVLSPGVRPAEPLARVELYKRSSPAAPKPKPLSSGRSSAGEEIIHGCGRIRRTFPATITIR